MIQHWTMLLMIALFAAAPLHAQTRTPAEADKLYHEVGDQLFCICGCREKLLTCSHNVCAQKTAERQYLRELSQISTHDGAAIKQEMVKRFGPQVLQVPDESSIFTVLAIALAALVAAFGGMFWYLAGRRKARSEADTVILTASPKGEKDALEERIDRDMQELDP